MQIVKKKEREVGMQKQQKGLNILLAQKTLTAQWLKYVADIRFLAGLETQKLMR